MLRVGQKVKLTKIAKENECYNDFKDDILIICNVATNTKEHPGYNNSMNGMPLYDFINCDCSLYEYEIKRV